MPHELPFNKKGAELSRFVSTMKLIHFTDINSITNIICFFECFLKAENQLYLTGVTKNN